MACDLTRGESLDVTLAYVKGKDAESEEVQEHTKQQQPGALRIKSKKITREDFWLAKPRSCDDGSPLLYRRPHVRYPRNGPGGDQ